MQVCGGNRTARGASVLKVSDEQDQDNCSCAIRGNRILKIRVETLVGDSDCDPHSDADELAVFQDLARGRHRRNLSFVDSDVSFERNQSLELPGADHSE